MVAFLFLLVTTVMAIRQLRLLTAKVSNNGVISAFIFFASVEAFKITIVVIIATANVETF